MRRAILVLLLGLAPIVSLAGEPATLRLPVPKPGPVSSMEGIRGAKLSVGGEVVQIDRIAWQRVLWQKTDSGKTPINRVTFAWVQGYNLKGESVRYTRSYDPDAAFPIEGLTGLKVTVKEDGFLVVADDPSQEIVVVDPTGSTITIQH